MADNVELNAGSGGATMATDDDGTAHHQYVKLEFGADNTQTKVDASNPLPVDLRTDNLAGNIDVNVAAGSLAVTNAGTFAVQVDGDALTSLQLLDDAVAAEGSALGKGVLLQGDDGTDRTNVLVDTAGHLQVDVLTAPSTAVTNAGTFVVQIDGDALTSLQLLDNAISGNEMQVDIVSSAAIPVTDNGGALTVDGTVTANLSATDNAVLDVIETNTSGSTSHYRNIDANAEAAIKASSGTLKWLHAMNLTASVAYLHLYDAGTGSVTPGTTTPDFTFPIPTQGDTNGAGFVLPAQIEFATAITLVVTTTLDGSTGDPGTNGVIINAGYT